MDQLPVDERTRVRRLPERQVVDRAVLAELLQQSLVAHVAVSRDGVPAVLPFACAPDGDALLLHGSTAAGVLRACAEGAPVAVAVTQLDALVVARSAFDSSMNYRSAVIFGVPEVLEGEDKLRGLQRLTEHLLPGRTGEVRPFSRREVAATTVLRLPLDQVSVKVRSGPAAADDDGEDRGVWAGVVPLAVAAGAPLADRDVPRGLPVPPSVRAVVERWSRRPG